MSGEMGGFSSIQKIVAFIAVMISFAIFSVAVTLLLCGLADGSLYMIAWGIVALIAGFVSSGLMYNYARNRRAQVKSLLSSEQETKTNSKSMLKQHFFIVGTVEQGTPYLKTNAINAVRNYCTNSTRAKIKEKRFFD